MNKEMGLQHKLLRLCLAGLPVVLLLGAEPNSGTQTITIDELLAKHIEACGGSNALKGVYSRRMVGEMSGIIVPEPSRFEHLAKAPDKLLNILHHPEFGKIYFGYDGSVAWSKTGSRVTIIKGEEAERMRLDAAFYRELNFQKIYPDLRLVGITNANAHTCFVVESQPTPSLVRRFYFDCRSYLIIREENIGRSDQGTRLVRVESSDYRKVDGIMIPFRLYIETHDPLLGLIKLQLLILKVEHNVLLSDDLFRKPE